jgi:thioredoxin 1
MSANLLSKPEPLLVACLCAQWCGVCRDYAPLMTRTLAAFDPGKVRMIWVDIEDHAEVLGDLDVESFPTLLLALGPDALFFGTLPPHAQTLERLVQGALSGDLPRLPPNPELLALLANVKVFQPDAC